MSYFCVKDSFQCNLLGFMLRGSLPQARINTGPGEDGGLLLASPFLKPLREYAWDPGSAWKPKSAETARRSPDLNPHCLNTTAAAGRPFKP